MNVIPAIDIKGGKCVRLKQGDMSSPTIFGADPVEMADKWLSCGANRLHLVDLDGAVCGETTNFSVISDICKNFSSKLKVQVGGGIRCFASIEAYLSLGVEWIILGSIAASNPEFVEKAVLKYPNRIIVGFDTRNGKIATDGWVNQSDLDVFDLVKSLPDGVSSVIFTDISKDGMMQGINVEQTVKLAKISAVPIIASGGLQSIEEIVHLKNCSNIEGVIAGRCIYEGSLDLTKAIAAAS